MSEARQKTPEPWACPWGICNHQQAQDCRADGRPGKGCGSRFAMETSPEQAKRMIGPATPPSVRRTT